MFTQIKPEALKYLKTINLPETLLYFDRLSWLKYGKKVLL